MKARAPPASMAGFLCGDSLGHRPALENAVVAILAGLFSFWLAWRRMIVSDALLDSGATKR